MGEVSLITGSEIGWASRGIRGHSNSSSGLTVRTLRTEDPKEKGKTNSLNLDGGLEPETHKARQVA